MAKIKHIQAREIFNSKGDPTLEVVVTLSDNNVGIASVPSGTSVGTYEAMELRDHDESRFKGLGVQQAIMNIENTIAPKLVGIEATHQQEVDRTMIDLDGTQNKSRLGANAMLGISIAVAKAAAASSVLPLFLYLREFLSKSTNAVRLPVPLFTILSGGLDNATLNFQEFLLIPASSQTFDQSLDMGYKVYNAVRDLIRANHFTTLTSDEGAFSPQLPTNVDALNFLMQGITNAGFRLGFDGFLGIDAAANTFYKSQKYQIRDSESTLSGKSLNSMYVSFVKQFNMLYLEDGLHEDDWESWSDLYTKLSSEIMIVGDDITATNPYRLQMAIDKKTINSIVIKPNQIGTVIESLAVVEVAKAAGLKIIASHRSGETNDNFLADFAVAISADYIKCGSLARGEHAAKYNRLLQIEQQLKLL